MSDKESKNKGKSPSKQDPLEFLLGKKKAEFVRYCLSQKSFYQAEAAFDLHWTIGITQYYCRSFSRHGLLSETRTSYKTFYQLNPDQFPKLFSK